MYVYKGYLNYYNKPVNMELFEIFNNNASVNKICFAHIFGFENVLHEIIQFL